MQRQKQMTPEEFQEKVVNRNKQINEARKKECDINRYQQEAVQRSRGKKKNFMSHSTAIYRLGS